MLSIKRLLTLTFCSLFFHFLQAQKVDNPHFVITFPSQHLQQEVSYWLQMIQDEELEMPADSMNLLILLDGDEYFGLARDVVNLYHFDEKILPTMVVALPSTMQSRWKYFTPTKAEPYPDSDQETQQLFNSSGEFAAFVQFVKKELLPRLEREAKTKFTNKTIFGHSMGGLGALNFLLNENDFFDNYIIASPSVIWDNYATLDRLEREGKAATKRYDFKKMYLAVAENDLGNYADDATYLIDFLTPLTDTTTTKIIHHNYPNETHTTVGLRTLFDGILNVLTR